MAMAKPSLNVAVLLEFPLTPFPHLNVITRDEPLVAPV
jgi:hypothetical protein